MKQTVRIAPWTLSMPLVEANQACLLETQQRCTKTIVGSWASDSNKLNYKAMLTQVAEDASQGSGKYLERMCMAI